ncbi:putative oxidoreductase [Bacillus sp. TS-2]|nr:putative oxidoreductase [Bacillus sp. TS-2]
MDTMLRAIQNRRTIRKLKAQSSLTVQEIKEILSTVVDYAPTAFHSQSSRVVLLMNEHHRTFWNMTEEMMKQVLTPEKFSLSQKKIKGYASGFGTLLFFDDEKVTEKVKKQKDPRFEQQFVTWADQSSAMMQFAIWTIFSEKGLGASIQHFNPHIDQACREKWGLPAEWRLIAQMPFGDIGEEPIQKEILPTDQKLKILE